MGPIVNKEKDKGDVGDEHAEEDDDDDDNNDDDDSEDAVEDADAADVVGDETYRRLSQFTGPSLPLCVKRLCAVVGGWIEEFVEDIEVVTSDCRGGPADDGRTVQHPDMDAWGRFSCFWSNF